MIRCAVLMMALLVLSAPGASQPLTDADFEVGIKRGIEQVYNLEFEKAETEFRALVQARPSHPAGHFFLAMVQWWRILIDIENEEYDDRFYDGLEYVVDLCDLMLKKNPDDVTALFFKGGSIGFRGRLKAHRREWLAAANAGRKALPIVQVASELDPNNHDIMLGSGIYNYYAEVIPEEYPFVKPLLLFIPPGDRQKGLAQLGVAAEKGRYAGIEATYFLMQAYYWHEKDYPKALALAEELHARFPNNMLFHRYVGRCHVVLNNWEKAREVFSEIVIRARSRQRGYGENIEREAEYYLGMYNMNSNAYESALKHFQRADELSRILDKDGASGFMVMANLKMGMLYDILAKRDLAVMQYNKVRKMKDYKDSHSQAKQYLKTPYMQ